MNPSQPSNRQILFLGELFGAWVFGWPLMADWLMHSGALARLLGLDPIKLVFPSLLELLHLKQLPWLAQYKTWLLGFGGVLLASTVSALVAWLNWKIAGATKIDRDAHAVNSVFWVARATVSINFAGLMALCGALVYAVIVLKDLTGWSYWTFVPVLAVVLLIGIPLLLCQKFVVHGESMGPWWRFKWPSLPVIVCVALVIAIAWCAGAMLPETTWSTVIGWTVMIVVDAVVVTLLVLRKLSRVETIYALKKILHWSNLRVWFVQELLVVCVAVAIAAPIIAISYLNIFGTPALVAALVQAGLEKPRWFTTFIQVSDYFRNHSYVALMLALVWPLAAWQALLSARLAHLQTQSTQ
jgi:hypothetical protein